MKFFSKNNLCAILTIAFSMSAFSAFAQDNKEDRKSPMAETSASVGDTQINITYSRPSVKGRAIFGTLVPYNGVWRTGANEATVFEVENDVLVEGQPLEAGRYALFTIPGEEEWTIIFNRTADQWGAYEYDPELDALRVNVAPSNAPEETEKLTFDIDQSGQVSMRWADTQVNFSVEEQ